MTDIQSLEEADADRLAALIDALNRHFGLEDATPDAGTLRGLLSGERPFLYGYIAASGGRDIGYALCQDFFDTDTGTMGIWLLDLYIDPAQRGAGLGRTLLARVAARAKAAGGRFVGWAVYADNPARRLYDRVGAAMEDDALVYELRDAALDSLAAEGQV